ncbi:DNA excision repair protein ERCC-1 [Merluccius polli]|uniref:DNA excision repair protein ERCC-1 n=1 Tax=Merluccius polli TaxID=89951 RepID=A0AA47MMV8_MERPO|nr:DNA excision repair protein ERCC-1 [Merluccius polli]
MEERRRFAVNLDDSAFTKERTPMKPLFQPSAQGGGGGVAPAEPARFRAVSYADFVVRNAEPAANAGTPSGIEEDRVAPRTEPDRADPGADGETPGERTDATGADDGQRGADQRTEAVPVPGPGPVMAPKPVGSGGSVIVSPRQRGNPILKFVRSVPWEFGEIVPDYVLGQTTCALFLSLRYHNLNPDYIHDRLKLLGQTFTLRVLLVQVDVKDPHHSLKELARMCILADCTLILAWSPEEAGRYLETYKSYEKKPADLLKEHVEKDYLSKVTDCLTTVKSINKTDSITLLSAFSSVKGIINASKEDLVLCPGLGPQKARRLHDVLHQPFLKSKRKDS